MNKGDITYEDIYNVMPFGSMIYVIIPKRFIRPKKTSRILPLLSFRKSSVLRFFLLYQHMAAYTIVQQPLRIL